MWLLQGTENTAQLWQFSQYEDEDKTYFQFAIECDPEKVLSTFLPNDDSLTDEKFLLSLRGTLFNYHYFSFKCLF